VALDSLELGHRAAIHEAAAFEPVDLRDREALFGVFARHQPEAILHFAAYALVGESVERTAAYFANNVGGACTLFEAMLAHDCRRLVFSSSCTVFGRPDRVPVTEDMPRHALNPYGASKIMIEEMAEWHARLSGMRTAILRYFNPAGASARFGEDRQVETHLVPLALAVAQGTRPHVTILGTDYPTPDGTCIRDYIHVVDLAEAHVRALAAQDQHELLAVNLGTGRGASVREVVETVRRVTGRPVPTVDGPRRPSGADSPVIYADPTLARELLGWQSERDLDAMIASAWEWRQRHPNGYGG
jgi:UDP-glucose-4-epimerase GalE